MIKAIHRRGPVFFPGAVRTEIKNGYEVVQEYENPGDGPWLVDLSHVPKWDIQNRNITDVRVWSLTPPERPSECILEQGRLICRLNRVQVAAWDLSCRAGELCLPFATEITDGLCLLAVVGNEALAVMERITPLDVFAPGVTPPVLIQGPVLHIPCRLVRLRQTETREAVLIGFSRGYGQSMAESMLSAAGDLGLRQGGEDVFKPMLDA